MNARHELKREAETIMLAGGFAEARAEHFGPWWRVYGRLAGDNEHVGTTHLQADPQDPREMARTLVARAKAEQITDEPAAPETVEDTFPQGEGPFDPQPEASETPQDETPEEEQIWETEEADHSVDGGGDGAGVGQVSVDPIKAATDEITNADFSEPIPDLPEIELIPPDSDPDFGAELLEFEGELSEPKEEAPSGAFIFGDNLDQKRTAAIGLVVQEALIRMPAEINYLALSELRNFTMGVSEGRWPDDLGKREELDSMEARERLRRAVEATRDAKVAFLVAATREQIEAFDPESDWP